MMMVLVSAIGRAAAPLARNVIAANEQRAAAQVGDAVCDAVVDQVQEFRQHATTVQVPVGVAGKDEQQSQPTEGRDPDRLVVVKVVGGGGGEADGEDKVERDLVSGVVQPLEGSGSRDKAEERE